MKVTTKTTLAIAMTAFLAQAQAAELKTDAEKVSYTIGVDMGQSIAQINKNGEINLDTLIDGLKTAYEGKDPQMSPEEMETAMKAFAEKRMKAMQQEMKQEAEKNAAEGKKFLDENKKKDGVETTDSGLQYKVDKKGDGDEQPGADDTVTVNYEGRLLDGTVFDSSYKRGEPVTFKLSEVIPGWTEGLQLMKKGAKYTFYIPAELAYGEQGAGPSIAPNSALVFDVELLDIKHADADSTKDSSDTQDTSDEQKSENADSQKDNKAQKKSD